MTHPRTWDRDLNGSLRDVDRSWLKADAAMTPQEQKELNTERAYVYDLSLGILCDGRCPLVKFNMGTILKKFTYRDSSKFNLAVEGWRLPIVNEISTLVLAPSGIAAGDTYPQNLFDNWEQVLWCTDTAGQLGVCTFSEDGLGCTFKEVDIARIDDWSRYLYTNPLGMEKLHP